MYVFIDDKNKKIGYVKKDRLIEIENLVESSLVHSIYKGRVIREDKSLGGYIVNFRNNEVALLRYKDSREKHKGQDTIIIEIIYDYLGEKIPLCTERYSIAGDFVVLSEGRGISFSKKISDRNLQERLRNIGEERNFHIKFRTNSINASTTEILDEIDNLKKPLLNMKAQLNFLPIPDLIYENRKVVYEYAKKNSIDDSFVIVNDKKRSNELNNLNVRYISDFDIYKDPKISNEYNRLTKRIVKFKNSNIVVDRLEALTVIDVNKEKAYINESMYKASEHVNYDACMEIANVISLNSFGGIVIIDFINMNKEGKNKIYGELKKALDFFNLRFKINGFTKSNLFELLIFR